MKILILSWYCPPANDVAALRVGKLAEYLQDSGHEVWILTAHRDHPDQSLSLSLAPERILRTSWFDVQQLRLHEAALVTTTIPPDVARNNVAPRRKPSSVVQFLNATYRNFTEIPDRQIGWLPYLLRAGRKFLKQQSVDLIYASGPPFTTFVAARRLSRQFSIRWIAEYRDGWSRYVYTPKPEWRQFLDERIENAVTRTASGIVAVTEPWSDHYRERFGVPTVAIYNGFDPESTSPAAARVCAANGPVTITYLGALYQGLRDPSLLYEGVRRSKLSPTDVQIVYHGPNPAEILPLAEKFGVSDYIVVRARVGYCQSLEIQRASDILLLLQSPDDPRNVPAKLFEYLAACRPILGLGLDEGIPARLIRERGAGFYISNADAVAGQLKYWVAEKRKTGVIADLPPSVRTGLSRSDQLARLETFLSSSI